MTSSFLTGLAMTDFSLMNTKIGRYEIQERIGRGGMAQVYKALDSNLDRAVAVKVLYEHLSDDPTFKERFEREAKFVASFNHPHIVQVYDFDSVERSGSRLYYMVMPLLPGKTLRDELEAFSKRGEYIPHSRVEQIILKLADALDYAHKRGMVHRDIKPANIMFDERDEAVLTDFGIARLVAASSLTQEGLTVGTPAYMSPEQATGDPVDACSDIYALGIILYELLTGKTPFHDDGSISVLLKHLNEPVPPLSNYLPMPIPALDMVIAKALAKMPEERYQTAGEFAEDVRRAFHGELVTAPSKITNAYLPAAKASKPLTALSTTQVKQQTRLTTTIQQVTAQVQTITHSPLGILIIGLVIIAGLIGYNLATRQQPTPTTQPTQIAGANAASTGSSSSITAASIDEGVDSMTRDNEPADSMTGLIEDFYFTTTFSADDPNRNLWTLSNDGMVIREFSEPSGYRFSNLRAGRALTSIMNTNYVYGSVTLTLEAILEDTSSDNAGYGLVFRYQDSDNYNVFAVDGKGRFSIWVRLNGTWRELRGLPNNEQWTADERINPKGELNRLTLDIFENRLVGYVNGKVVTNVRDDSFSTGAIGLYLAAPPNDGQAIMYVTQFGATDVTESMTTSMTGEDGKPSRDLR
jgi:serine/threonine protein kinase